MTSMSALSKTENIKKAFIAGMIRFRAENAIAMC